MSKAFYFCYKKYYKIDRKVEVRMMDKDIFKQALEKHNLTLDQFLDLRDAWDQLGWGVKEEMLKKGCAFA